VGADSTLGTKPGEDEVGHQFTHPESRGYSCQHTQYDRTFDSRKKKLNDCAGKAVYFNGPYLLPDISRSVVKDRDTVLVYDFFLDLLQSHWVNRFKCSGRGRAASIIF